MKLFCVLEAVVCRCSLKKMFLKILQNSLENTSLGVSFYQKRLRHRNFPVNFPKVLRRPFFKGHLWGLLSDMLSYKAQL